jgi:conjugative relaxase-like TrwC/TraI family protein
MVGKKEFTSSKALTDYHERHLSADEYHLEEGRSHGWFFGELAKDWKLDVTTIRSGDKRFREFAELNIADLSGQNGLRRPRRSSRRAIDFTFSAPKSVSVAAVLDPRLGIELRSAVAEEMRWFEQYASARDRRGEHYQSEASRQTGKVLGAAFLHETSRAHDPDLHCHCLIANITIDPERKQALALDYGMMFELRKTLDARIINNLAARCARLGYTVETAPHAFRLREIPLEVERAHSVRSREIQTAKRLLAKGYTVEQLTQALRGLNIEEKSELWVTGRIQDRLEIPGLPSARKVNEYDLDEQAWLVTRRPKEHSSREDIRTKVQQSFRQAGFEFPKPPVRTAEPPAREDLKSVISQGLKSVFERETVVRLDDLVGEIVRLAPGRCSNAAIETALQNQSELVHLRIEGKRMVTTGAVVAEEQAIVQAVKSGLGQHRAIINGTEYQTSADLFPSPERVEDIVTDAKARGEEMTPDLAKEWLRQHAEVHRYVLTSNDQFINVRGGAGVGKTFSMERLVRASLDAGRTVVLCAPYGEQSRVTLRGEVSRLEEEGKHAVAQAFREANTVASILTKARFQPEFRNSIRGGDIYVDEAGLLDNDTMLRVVALAKQERARVIFQGDTQQLQAVGRGQPLRLLEKKLKLGMHVARIDISRRQLRLEDKRLAKELSSGSPHRFKAALDRLIERGSIKRGGVDEAVAAIIDNRLKNRDTVVLSSTHRLGEQISERLHLEYRRVNPDKKQASIAAFRLKNLRRPELLSTAAYEIGDMVEYKDPECKQARLAQVEGIFFEGVRIHGQRAIVEFEDVHAAYSRLTLERGIGETLVLTARIKQNRRIYENGSRQVIDAIEGNLIRFQSGLCLATDDGRVRQGDALTSYKAQGTSRLEMIRVEDNQSVRAMVNREDLYVAFTRHRATARMFVENIEVFQTVANRSCAEKSPVHYDSPQIEPSEAIMIQIPNQSFEDEAKSWYTRAKGAEQRGLWSDVRRNKAHGDRCVQLDRLQKAYETGDQKTAEGLIKKGGISELEARVTRDRAALAIQASTGKQMREAIQSLHPNDPKRQRIQNSREYMAARLMEIRETKAVQ